jgi:hypothetical protein
MFHNTNISNAIDPADRVVDHQLRLDLVHVLDQDKDADHRVVRGADVAVDVPHLQETALDLGHAADMADRLEGSVDPLLVLVLRREVHRHKLDEVLILYEEVEVYLLVMNKAELVPAYVDGPRCMATSLKKG